MQLFTKFHQVGSLFLVLIAKTFVDCDEAQTFRISSFAGDAELISDCAAKDGISKLCFFSTGELAHLAVGFFELLCLAEFFIGPELEPVANVEDTAAIGFAFIEAIDKGLYIFFEVQGLVFEAVLLPVGGLWEGVEQLVPKLFYNSIGNWPDAQLDIGIGKPVEVDSTQGLIE